MFSKMFQMSLFNHILRLAIVVLCLSYSIAALAGSKDYYSAVKVTITGGGKVYVKPEGSNSETQLTSTGVVAGKKNESWGMGGSDPGKSTNHSYTVRADASGTNYYFSGWKDGNNIISTNPYTVTISETKYTDKTSAETVPNKEIEAIFNPYVTLPNEIKFVVYSDEMDVASVQMKNIYKRTILTLSLIGTDAGKFQLGKAINNTSEESISFGSEDGLDGNTTKDLIYAYINYSDGEYDPEKALAVSDVKLQVVDNESHTWEIPIKVTKPESYTFLSAAGGKYTVTFNNADQTIIENISEDQDPVYLRSDMYSFNLIATPDDGYKFFAWQTVDENGVGTLFPEKAYDSKILGHSFTSSTTIRPIFLPADQATFIIKEDPNKTPYYDLQEALNIANTTNGYSTVVFNAPTKGTTGTLYPRKNADGTIIPYEVPAGVTLLIPGDAAYTCKNDKLAETDYAESYSKPTAGAYAKLIMEDGVQLNVKGVLNVHGLPCAAMGSNGSVNAFGQIHLQGNASVTMQSSSKLYAYGYITGESSTNVTIDEGAYLYELFQFTDWRGGTAASKVVGNAGKYKVFPIAQYYAQNVEAPLTLIYGATQRVMTAVRVDFLGTKTYAADVPLVVSGESGGMFCLTARTMLKRTYDSQTDYVTYEIIGQGLDTKVFLSDISMSMYITVNSSDYVLPINNNIHVIAKNITLDSKYDVSLLPGSSVTINDDARLLISKGNFYVMDGSDRLVKQNEKRVGYFGSGPKELAPLPYSPTRPSTVKRTLTDESHAQLIVNGSVEIAQGAQLITTSKGSSIISTKDGAIVDDQNQQSFTASTLYQAPQVSSDVSYIAISTTPAKLRNSDGTYVETSKVYPGTYTYYITNESTKAGVWSLPPATIDDTSWEGTSVVAYMPNSPADMFITCKVNNVGSDSYANAFTGELSNTDNFAFAVENDFAKSLEFDAVNNILKVKVKYTPRNNTAEPATAELTLKNATVPTPEYTFLTTLTATEVYSPEFEINQTEVTLPKTNPGVQSSKSDAFTITPTSGTVATLTKADGLTWSYTLDAPFGYTGIVDGILDNENNNVTFNAATSGTHTKTLTIIATYTPAKGGTPVSVSKEVTLIGTSLTPNTLAFDMPDEIKVTDENVLVKFTGQNNTSDITVTIDNSSVAELKKNPDGSYVINALSAGTFILTATQEDAGTFAGTTTTCQITVTKLTPNPTWNWGVVYGNQEYTLPFDPSTVVEGEWTLKKTTDEKNLLEYDADSKTLKVHNINVQSPASFVFKQNETHDYAATPEEGIVLNTTINTDPRILPFTITDDAQYEIIETESSDGAGSYLGNVIIPANAYIILQFVGIPNEFSFTTNAEIIELEVSESINAQDGTWSILQKNENQYVWKFSTYSQSQYIKIYNNGTTDVVISNVSISSYEAERKVYYAKVVAESNPSGVGQVAVVGSWSGLSDDESMKTPFIQKNYASTWSGYAYVGADYLAAMGNGSMIFDLYAKATTNGYYFTSWTPLGHYLGNPGAGNAPSNEDYKKQIVLNNVTDMYFGYDYPIYQTMYKYTYPEHFNPETGEPLDPVLVNAATLTLIPATHIGTWQANFALAEVGSAENVAWDDVTSPHPTDVATHDVVFNILGDDTNDFVASIEEGKGFTFTEDDITLSVVNNTYTIKVAYTPQDVHDTHTTTFTLSRAEVKGAEPSTKTITLTATEDLTPSFTLENGDFGSGTLGQATIIDITPANKNKVAQVLDPAKLTWEASLSENAPFEIVSIAEDGTCKVRYFRTESGEKLATLTITATYTDSKGTQIPFATTCTLTGSSTAEKAANTLALKQGIVLYVNDEPISPFSNLDANNTEGIKISLPNGCTALEVEGGMIKPSGDFTTGDFTITVSQAENDYFHASSNLTTTVTVKKHTPEVTWNWGTLYFGQTYETPITTNSNGMLTISDLDDKNIVHYDDAQKKVSIEPLTEGEYVVNFSIVIAESNLYERYEDTYSATIYKDPRHLRVDVNEALTYRSVTIADKTGENVSFADGGIHFADMAGSEYESRQWTMYFIGVPDQLFFTPSGNNAWEIRESSNGSNWRTTFASSKLPAGEQFAMSLSPNTTHVRIVYATNADAPSNGVLNSFYITALEGVKANVDGLYMPIAANVETSPTTKPVVLQYTSQEKLTISTSDPQFVVDEVELPSVAVDAYGDMTIWVTSKATTEKEGRIYVKNAAGDILLELPIYTFIFPQTLPIQLATDEPQRFYYVTTASNYVKWDKTTRVVTLQNAPANTTRSLTFAFDGAPTLLRFNHTAGDRGTWTVWESANNTDWYGAVPATRVVNGNEIEQGLLNTTRYVRLEYTSPYSEKVEVSNLIIVGDASVTTDVNVLEFTETQPTSTLNVTAINLADFDVQIGNKNFTVTSFDKTALTGNGIVEVPVSITWAATTAVEYATLTIVNPNDDHAVLATVELVGKKQSISGPTHIGIYTGLAENITKLNGTFEGTERRPVDLTNAFDADTQTKALFDYLLIYGETSTMDGSTIITTPTNQRGSNAKTPCYIYQREGDTYKLLKVVDNVNDQDKAWSGAIPVPVSDIPTRVYITGFAPYASTGYTKEEEGVWCFRGQAGSKLDVYLEDSYIYSRYKTIDGHSFIDRDNGESFAEQYARGSGGVLVFECSSVGNKDNPFKVNIHTMDRNLLKSHYGCFLSSIVGRAFQVSSPIQVHLISTDITAATHLSFDDIWPTAITRTTTDGVVTAEEVSTKRTNGFISLQKQVNNAPSIDLGSPETVVNFNGGQVELQNAQNVSDNYKTTLAISYRGGKFAGYFLAHGVGSDEVTGTVNFNDGTTTVIPMTVDERYRQYYLMDEDEHGNELNITSCLRCPQNTYVYGGSHCMMRACNEPTSKGGAPWSHAGEGAVRLGMYKYPYASYITGEGDDAVTHAGGWTVIEGGNGLVSIPEDYVPNIEVAGQVARQYGVASVMPNDNGTPDVAEDDYLNFWVPAGYDDSVTPEVDLKVSYWKAAMTKIKAEYASYGGEVGGNIQIGDDTEVETELVYNLLYCVLDNDIRQVISAKEIIDGKEVYKYAAPVKHPAAAGYLEVRPSEVGTDPANYVENQNPYEVQNRVYYITPIASADNWMTFTAPFDVENIYVVETYDEKVLATQGSKAEIKIKQAEHNADFAAFFGVALALGSDRDFEDIYANYIGWAKLQDVGKYTGQYNLRGKHELEYYDGTNWSTANYYLYENQGTWTINADGVFTTQWTLPGVSDEILMNKGETYSLLFPYCTGCWEYDEDGNFIERTMWDYWSGKFVIFESTLRSEENPHVIDGVNTAQAYVETHTPAPSEAYVLGNTSFGDLRITNEHLYQYVSKDPLYEEFKPVGNVSTAIQPTSSFLLANITAPAGQKITGIRRTGEIIYDKHGTSDVGHIPTVGGGHDLFITSIEGGINVAVAAPQYVRVLSSTGSVIYSGMIQTALDIQLPSLGMYVVSGEKEVQKVMY